MDGGKLTIGSAKAATAGRGYLTDDQNPPREMEGLQQYIERGPGKIRDMIIVAELGVGTDEVVQLAGGVLSRRPVREKPDIVEEDGKGRHCGGSPAYVS